MSETNPGSEARKSRTNSAIAVAGLLAIGVGMIIFRMGFQFVPAWIAWLVAPLLWYAGFAMLVGWAFVRMLNMLRNSQRQRSARKEDAELARPTRPPIVASSEFAEHDFLLEQVREMA